MRGTLARHRPHVVVELHRRSDAVRLLEEAGYVCTPVGRAPSLEATRRGGHVHATPRAAAAP
jgi:hypothetical protein